MAALAAGPSGAPRRWIVKAISLSTPLRVLVVDDWPDTAESMAVLLRLWGHDVRIAHDGPTALAVAALYRPNVVLLDVGLPGMDGYQVARRMRNDLRLREAFLVSLTGYGQDSDMWRSRQAGCDRHLLKPVDPNVLESLLASQKETRHEESVVQVPALECRALASVPVKLSV
jgi:CheY-like chemotaxis protein